MKYLQKISWQRLTICAGVVWASCTFSAQMAVASELDDCMVQAMHTGSDNTTIGELRLQCENRFMLVRIPIKKLTGQLLILLKSAAGRMTSMYYNRLL